MSDARCSRGNGLLILIRVTVKSDARCSRGNGLFILIRVTVMSDARYCIPFPLPIANRKQANLSAIQANLSAIQANQSAI